MAVIAQVGSLEVAAVVVMERPGSQVAVLRLVVLLLYGLI